MSLRAGRFVAASSGIALILALASPALTLADPITVTRTCDNLADTACAVQLAPVPAASVVTVGGPSTALGPAIELNLAVSQNADAGSSVHAIGGLTGRAGGSTQSSGVGTNNFEVSVGQTGTATATSGGASAGSSGALVGNSGATQNADPGASGGNSGSDPGAGGGSTPPAGGGSGINMITNVATIVQIVQIVAHNNTNTTITPILVAQQCQQAAAACGSPTSGH